jgi:hypothetical protein
VAIGVFLLLPNPGITAVSCPDILCKVITSWVDNRRDKECKEALLRLANMTRGMGNPLVAAYARCYLAKVATEVVGYTGEKKYILSCIDDTLDTIPKVTNQK